MRGKVKLLAEGLRNPGITPAHAGKRRLPANHSLSSWDHPRACGEKLHFFAVLLRVKGSPPRMRGKACFAKSAVRFSGITPAHAGKSHKAANQDDFVQDHPRACGEKRACPRLQNIKKGSPPRMRGKVCRKLGSLTNQGITPAHAGKSQIDEIDHITSQDHPRACGEKSIMRSFICGSSGSPPRMRGKEGEIAKALPSVRITPAHAGKSDRLTHACRRPRDHPRACGEKASANPVTVGGFGSPPRMRGKVGLAQNPDCPARITPAHAGKSPAMCASAAAKRDHPRACGEKLTF